MEVAIKEIENITVVEIVGDVDGKSAPEAQKQILPLIVPGGRILLDMTGVPYMSSAGLRMLLSAYRQATASKGYLVLVGLADEVRDTMSATGFLSYFITHPTVETGLEELRNASGTIWNQS